MVAVVAAATAVVWQVQRGGSDESADTAAPAASTPPATSAPTSLEPSTGPTPSDSATTSGADPTTTIVTTSPAQVARAAPSQDSSQRPRTIVLPSGTAVPVRIATTGADGALRLPTDVRRAGWWDGSARLGDPLGSIVVAAHVDSFDQGLGVFAQLLSIHRGADVVVTSGGLSQRFEVTSARLVPKTSLTSTSPLYTAQTPSRLVLITCGGSFEPAKGGYQDNFVVVAEPRGDLHR